MLDIRRSGEDEILRHFEKLEDPLHFARSDGCHPQGM
jgi:hypothetical protein